MVTQPFAGISLNSGYNLSQARFENLVATFVVPAATMKGTATDGAGNANGKAERQEFGNGPNVDYMEFDTAVDQHAYWQIPFPASWDVGDIYWDILWYATAGGSSTQTVRWNLGIRSVADVEQIDGLAYTYGEANEDTRGTLDALHIVQGGRTTPLSVSDAGQADEGFWILQREGTHANDDFGGAARVVEVRLYYTKAVLTD